MIKPIHFGQFADFVVQTQQLIILVQLQMEEKEGYVMP